MLKELHIKNYVLIDSLDIEFPAGLVIITGQTGAGKSIILGALSLVLGSKADASAIGASGDTCVVEAVFDLKDEDGSIRALLDENEIDYDSDELIIRRVINASGRSRSFVNDSPAPLKVLSALSSRCCSGTRLSRCQCWTILPMMPLSFPHAVRLGRN